jgi:hypothetical protein
VSEAAITPASRRAGIRGDVFAFHEARRACSLAPTRAKEEWKQIQEGR